MPKLFQKSIPIMEKAPHEVKCSGNHLILQFNQLFHIFVKIYHAKQKANDNTSTFQSKLLLSIFLVNMTLTHLSESQAR